MQILEGLVGIFLEGVLKGVGNILIEQRDRVVIWLSTSQIDGIFMCDIFKFVNLKSQLVIFLLILKHVSLFDQHLRNLWVGDIQYPKWKLNPLHLVHKRNSRAHTNNQNNIKSKDTPFETNANQARRALWERVGSSGSICYWFACFW